MKQVIKHPHYRRARQGASWLMWFILAASVAIILTSSTAELTMVP